jgi:hypothetical protein
MEAMVEGTMHPECALRIVTGPLAHLQRKCHCFVRDSGEHDPPGITKREAARAAAQLYQKLIELGVEPFNERVRR